MNIGITNHLAEKAKETIQRMIDHGLSEAETEVNDFFVTTAPQDMPGIVPLHTFEIEGREYTLCHRT